MTSIMINSRQTGMTLIEIMIAMVIGLFLLAGVMQIFQSSHQSYRLQDNLSRMQENGRFAMNFITKDIRMAGYLGCLFSEPNRILDPKNPNPNPMPVTAVADKLSVIGHNNITNNWRISTCGSSNQCIVNTDAISLQFSQVCANLSKDEASLNANIQIPAPNSCNIKQYDVLIISDCKNADMFVATSASLGSGKQTIAHANNQNTTNKLSTLYTTDAQILKLNSFSYFIRQGVNGQPALWRTNNTKRKSGVNPVELVEYIENMQILYGEDANGDHTPDYYLPANQIVDMDKVISIRVSLLVMSPDDHLVTKAVDYRYNGTTITPTDKRLRQVFSSTIAVRNRLP